MRRLFLLPTALLAVGCAAQPGQGNPSGDPGAVRAAFEARATAVADAWRDSTATGAWRTGFVPLQDLTIPPKGGFPDDATKQAFINGWYTTNAPLPGVPFAPGEVRFPDGSTMRVPLVAGAVAYAAMDHGDSPCPPGAVPPVVPPTPTGTGPDAPVGTPAPQSCGMLTVTEVTLGETVIRTSRGDATAPAWLFTTRELTEPIARVAVSPTAIAAVPSPSLPPLEHTPGLVNAQDLVRVDGARLEYRLGVGACDEDIRPLVHETDEVVVVGGSVVTTGEVCIDLLKLEPVTVTLAKPLGARPVVEVAGGQPLLLTVR